LDAAQKLIEKYKLPHYYSQRILLIREEIRTLFECKKSPQITLTDFA